jgi:hypothetical protein
MAFVKFAFLAFLCFASWVFSQEGKVPPRKAAPQLLDNEIDTLLQDWHTKTRNITILYAEFERTITDTAFRVKKINRGQARFEHPFKARMDISKDAQGRGREIFLVNELPNPRGVKTLQFYHYIVDDRRLEIIEFKNARAGDRNAQEEGPLRLLFGIKPDVAHSQYDFEIKNRSHEVIEIGVIPKIQKLKEEFLRADILLDRESFMPKRMAVQETAQTLVEYKFDRIVTNLSKEVPQFEPQHWNPPDVTGQEGWKVTRQERILEAASNPPLDQRR